MTDTLDELADEIGTITTEQEETPSKAVSEGGDD